MTCEKNKKKLNGENERKEIKKKCHYSELMSNFDKNNFVLSFFYEKKLKKNIENLKTSWAGATAFL